MATKSGKKINSKTCQSTEIGKKAPIRKKLEYDRMLDPNSNCYFDQKDGTYVYVRHIKNGNTWKKEIVARIDPKEYPDCAEIIQELEQWDYEEDVREEVYSENRDMNFQRFLRQFEDPNEYRVFSDPWENIALDHGGKDILDWLFPEEVSENERLKLLDSFLNTLLPQQIILFNAHLHQRRSLEDLRREEEARTGRKISRQGFNNRWNKILKRARRYFKTDLST